MKNVPKDISHFMDFLKNVTINVLMMTRLLKMKSKSRTRLCGAVNEKLMQEAPGTGVTTPHNPAAKTRNRVMGTESYNRHQVAPRSTLTQCEIVLH